MYKKFGIDERVIELSNKVTEDIKPIFEQIDKNCELNTLKVLSSFNKYNISDMHFGTTTGYGYGDVGRDTIEKVFADVLGAEDCLVRGQFISGTHALTVALFAMLRPNDTMLSICGKPYDTLDEVIGIKDNPSSLKSFNIKNVEEKPYFKLLIETNKRFLPILAILVPEELEDKVEDNLSRVVKRSQVDETGSAVFMDKIGF